jgi:acyl-CoA synthetase (AMP-forming)/AMP-acid ligase II
VTQSHLASLLSESSREGPARLALAHGDATLTYAQLGAAVERLCDALAVAPGEAVAVVAPNVPALAVGLFAAWRAGAVAVPLSARLRRFELERAFADAEPAATVTVPAHAGFALAEEIQRLGERTASVRACVVIDELGAVVRQSRASLGERAPELPSELAAIMYTSGTTGEPKGALMPHALGYAMARNVAALLGEHASAPYGLVVPASHMFGLGCLLSGVLAGAAAVLVDATTSLEPLLQAMRHHDAHVLHGSPALFARMLRAGAENPIRSGFTAGSTCPPDVLKALDERGVRLLNLFGMTEIGAASSCRMQDPPDVRYRTVGRPLDGYELRVAPAPPTIGAGDGRDAPARDRTDAPAGCPADAPAGYPADAPAGEHAPATLGEIQVRSDYLPSGYHRRPWGEEDLSADGWFRTGDLGWLDGAGNLTIGGRAKEVVHVGGFNVFPAEVESFLMTHPAIAQAGVIGVPHRALGEALEAFVVLNPDAALAPREVIAFARAGIAGYKVPYAVHLLDELPLLSSGKPDRRALLGASSRAPAPTSMPAAARR